MRMYLSSFRLGSDPDVFVRLMGGRRRVLVIANGLDGDDPDTRAERVRDELRRLQEIGMEAEELDLRDYVGRTSSLRDQLEACGAVGPHHPSSRIGPDTGSCSSQHDPDRQRGTRGYQIDHTCIRR